MRIDFVYGLPGVGKTTLCKNIKNSFFIDIVLDKIKFETGKFFEIFKDIYEKNKYHDYYITEACLINYKFRNEYIKKICNCFEPKIVNVFYLYTDDLKELAERRSIRYEEFKLLYKNIQIGAELGNHYVIGAKSLKKRIEFIESVKI